MKTLLFYCQPTPGIDHLVRSMAIAQGLTQDFKVYLVNSGDVIQEFPVPEGIEIINLPAIEMDPDVHELQIPEHFSDVDGALEYRRDRILELCDRIRPDAIIVELFPFGHHRFTPELIPLLERARSYGTKTICSLRDIVVPKQKNAHCEARICQLMNLYFDQLLIHGDPSFIPLEASFSRLSHLTCEIHYTGYVVPDVDREFPTKADREPPTIVVSVGGGHVGHDLLDCVAEASHFLEDKIPHHIQMFTGPFAPIKGYNRLQTMATRCSNLTVERYTPDLLSYMAKADLSINMASYNTTLNVLQAGGRAMQLPLRSNNDYEQQLRSKRLAKLGIVKVLEPADLEPIHFSLEVLDTLMRTPKPIYFCLRGVQITAARVEELVTAKNVADKAAHHRYSRLSPENIINLRQM